VDSPCTACTRFPSFLPGLELPGILRSFLRTKFLDYPEVADRALILAACSQLALAGAWSGPPPGPRDLSQETFYLYNPRQRSMARQGHPQFDQSQETSSSQSFDLSCDNFNQNITGLSLFTRSTPDMELLKRITLTFCDGSEKSVSTQVGEHDEEVHLALGGGAGQHVLLVSAPAEAADSTDPLALLTNSTFLLSDGSLVGLTPRGARDGRSDSVLDLLPATVHSANLR